MLFISGAAGYTWFSGENGIDALNGWSGEVRGTVEHQFANKVGFQVDTAFDYQKFGDYEGGDIHEETLGVTGHVFYRQPDQWLLGAIAQYDSDTYHPFSEGIDRYYVGGEGSGIFRQFHDLWPGRICAGIV